MNSGGKAMGKLKVVSLCGCCGISNQQWIGCAEDI